MIGGVISLLPPVLQAKIREDISLTTRLDYPVEILMCADSKLEAKRANACSKEPETVAWIEDYVKAGDVFYDIGACVGAYGLVAEKNGARVYAFEPSFANFSTLCKNIALNNSTVVPVPVALTEKTMIRDFSYRSLRPGTALHSFDKEGKRLPVLCYSLDEFVEQFHIPYPDHLKIDVDGGETQVLKGAKQCLAHTKTLLIETEKEDVTPFLTGFTLHATHPRSKHFNNKLFIANHLRKMSYPQSA